MRRVVVLLAVLCVCDGVKFGQLCSGNSNNTMRTSDKWGDGHYGAQRGNGTHKGLDIVCSDGSTVLAPFNVTLEGGINIFNDNKTTINRGINLRGEGLCFKLLSVMPDQTSGSVGKGQRIGTMLPMQEMCDRTDPTPYFN
uniref:Uncharacterized protein n=1 Tax=Lates calcarifer TaxID=8187 RepID=A0A4W6FSV4_LATCA